MNPEFEVQPTSRDVAESPDVPPDRHHDRQPQPSPAASVPSDLDKRPGELESVDDDRHRVEKRTTL